MTSPAPSSIDLGDFDVLTFDCYGTLIDWESGILAAIRPILDAHRVSAPGDAVLEAFGRHESEIEAGPYTRYRDVLGGVLTAILEPFGEVPTDEEVARFGGSVVDWPAFPDSAAALASLHERFRLGVITNCDDDLFAASAARLGFEPDWVITAQQAKRYKPNPRNFELAFERIGLPPKRILHVAQSLFHDHVPAKRLGLSTVWVDRRGGRAGSGATPPATATPDLVVPDMATLARLAEAAVPAA
ncbi:MAG TPA: haloacid dehalogenase type II [Candidatus Limnocylindrales bacterium]